MKNSDDTPQRNNHKVKSPIRFIRVVINGDNVVIYTNPKNILSTIGLGTIASSIWWLVQNLHL